jgi:hypothetical protein
MDLSAYAGAESKYLKADDLKDSAGKSLHIRATIERVELVEFENDDGSKQQKPALKLTNKEKGVVCNATTVQELGMAHGFDSDAWIGQEIGLSIKHYATLGKDGIVVTAIKDFSESDIDF